MGEARRASTPDHSDIAEVSEEIAEAIRDCLSEQFGYEAVKEGEDNPYGDDALYEEKRIDDWNFRESWAFFKTHIKTRSRFSANTRNRC